MQLQATTKCTWPTGVPTTVTRNGMRLTLAWASGATTSVPLIWLRDNCVCDECRILSTGEHRYFLGGTPELPDAEAIALVAGTVSIRWVDGHLSEFTPADFARLAYVASRSNPVAELWADDFSAKRFDHDEILQDPKVRIDFFTTAMRDGMAVATSVPTEPGECVRFLEALGVPIRDTPFDRVHDVYFRTDGYNVAHTAEPLPPHNDFASYQWPPSGQLIHMLVNDVSGGEWVNVDGWKVVAQLQARDPEAVATLARVPVAFREHSDGAESWTRAPIVRLDPAGNVTGIRFSNQLMQPLDPTSPDVETFYAAYHQLAKAVADPANQLVFRGNAGDMQFLYGHRVLHARRGFDRNSGARHLQDTYFDFDDIAALAARTSGEAR